MAQAIKLAKKGLGQCKPNPIVGAVIVVDDKIIATGYHQEFGGPHAEVVAINNCKDKTLLKKSTLYVTLEPCAHEGKTPPCLDLILEQNIKRVVIASQDPNPKVNGNSIASLIDKGVKVDIGLMEDQAINLNKGFFKRILNNIPRVTSKIAVSSDGKTALNNFQSKWISNEFSRSDVQRLRRLSDGILTSYKTINRDDPRLTVRDVDSSKQPYRFIIDASFQSNSDAHIFKQEKVVIFYSKEITNKPDLKAICIPVSCVDGVLNFTEIMKHIASMEVNNLLVEAGPGLNGLLLQHRMIDELIIYQSQSLLGGNAREMFNHPVITAMESRNQLKLKDCRFFGDDIRFIYEIDYVD
jgi:diaminohydroxyphosphoribosylaminopyrimidine deaminase/5-amino-6-(5-phosphoribosylamino)uracil reductase